MSIPFLFYFIFFCVCLFPQCIQAMVKKISDLDLDLLSPSPGFSEESLQRLKHTLPEVIAAAFERLSHTTRDSLKGMV